MVQIHPNIDGYCRRAQVHCVGRACTCCRLCWRRDRAGMYSFLLERESDSDHPNLHLRFHECRHQLPLNLVLLKNVSVVGIFWGSYTCTLIVWMHAERALTFPPRTQRKARSVLRRCGRSYSRYSPPASSNRSFTRGSTRSTRSTKALMTLSIAGRGARQSSVCGNVLQQGNCE